MHFSSIVKWIFLVSAAIFSISVVETVRVQISGKVVSTNTSKDKLSPGNSKLRILLAQEEQEGKEPDWENKEKTKQANVGSDGTYKFDFDVTDMSHTLAARFMWGLAADSRIWQLQTGSQLPVILRVMKATTKTIDVHADISGRPIVSLPNQTGAVAKGAAAFNVDKAEGLKVGIVKLVESGVIDDVKNKYGLTKLITAKPPPEVEAPKEYGKLKDGQKELWNGSQTEVEQTPRANNTPGSRLNPETLAKFKPTSEPEKPARVATPRKKFADTPAFLTKNQAMPAGERPQPKALSSPFLNKGPKGAVPKSSAVPNSAADEPAANSAAVNSAAANSAAQT